MDSIAGVISRNNADHYTWAQVCDGWHLLNQPDLSVIEERAPQGTEEVRHFHSKARQLFYVLAGSVELERAGRLYRLESGDSLEVPPGVSHQLRNPGPGEARFLVVSSPRSHGDRTLVAQG